MRKLRILFMGTPDFAVETLKRILQANYEVAAVITAPDKPAGRGRKIKATPVKVFAMEQGLRILQPEKLKNKDFIDEVKSLDVNLGVVVAFRMLPEVLWSLPELGTFNLHASLLPNYRGAAPINHAIINGEKETGVSTFFLRHEIDTGDIIQQERVKIEDEEIAGELHDKLMMTGAELVIRTLELIEKEEVRTLDQNEIIGDEKSLKAAPKIYKEFCQINWQSDVEDIYNKIRGLSPMPSSFTFFRKPNDEEPVKVNVYRSSMERMEISNKKPGQIETDGKNYLKIVCGHGKISILELKVAGKKKLGIADFLRGFKITDDWVAE